MLARIVLTLLLGWLLRIVDKIKLKKLSLSNKIQSFSEYGTHERLVRRIIRMNPVTKQN